MKALDDLLEDGFALAGDVIEWAFNVPVIPLMVAGVVIVFAVLVCLPLGVVARVLGRKADA